MSFSRMAAKQSPSMFADALGKSRIVGGKPEIFARRLGDLGQGVQRQKARQNGDAIIRDIERLDDELTQRG